MRNTHFQKCFKTLAFVIMMRLVDTYWMPSPLCVRGCSVLFILSADLEERYHSNSHAVEEKTEGADTKMTKSLHAQWENGEQAAGAGSEAMVSSPASVCAVEKSSSGIRRYRRILAERDLGVICHLTLQTAVLRPEQEVSLTHSRRGSEGTETSPVSQFPARLSFPTPRCLP